MGMDDVSPLARLSIETFALLASGTVKGIVPSLLNVELSELIKYGRHKGGWTVGCLMTGATESMRPAGSRVWWQVQEPPPLPARELGPQGVSSDHPMYTCAHASCVLTERCPDVCRPSFYRTAPITTGIPTPLGLESCSEVTLIDPAPLH
eukprot:1175736-Prorocentrum_minimum.AAC.4